MDAIAKNSTKSIIHIFIYNLSFYGVVLLEAFSEKNITFKIISRRSEIYAISVNYLNRNIEFRCLYKLLPISLNKVSEIENIKKRAFPYKFICKENLFYVGISPNIDFWNKKDYMNHVSCPSDQVFNFKKEIELVCSDNAKLVKILVENLFSIIEKNYPKVFYNCRSTAGLSHKIFFTYHNIKNIPQVITKSEEEYIRDSYYGGRCEIFGNLEESEHIKYYDFKGMYAECMLEKFHNGIGCYSNETDFTKPGYYSIEYESNFDFLPVLPFHTETGQLLFPNRKGTGVFWFEEIHLFLKKGGVVKKILNSYVYQDYEEVFHEFVDVFKGIKNLGGYYEVFGKLMINSLYGSMALREEKEILYMTYSEAEFYFILENLTVNSFYSISRTFVLVIENDYKYEKYLKRKKNTNTTRNISYASAITAKARIKLFNFMESVILDGGRLLYCDTDSVFAAYPKKDQKKQIGDKDWLDFYDDGIFIAPKAYWLKKKSKEKIKIKGVNLENKTLDDFKILFYGGKMIESNNISTFFDSRLKQNSTSVFSLNNYQKRKFTLDKKSTSPLYL